ncbi:hypothetical protein PHYSODRAFT_296809 [Phytophthora sojae]|uniref:Uncharacterized protein n=1 Tax=Phytophthora sojae (strain P6497) TaxID=1094619 RepID=G4YUI9_PHYSP|nr:hypothetical protein PHYSODRAFT_296809 [Phytophthora sojae]EGZ24881.1 hypothetical protein PHYSODRAFT_296809 [Phytophthora sojae]|eukprot:XP_009520169.1 hypothetical protein PHYSODRAFT_296809 [Phytophthora sojae]
MSCGDIAVCVSFASCFGAAGSQESVSEVAFGSMAVTISTLPPVRQVLARRGSPNTQSPHDYRETLYSTQGSHVTDTGVIAPGSTSELQPTRCQAARMIKIFEHAREDSNKQCECIDVENDLGVWNFS